ncbi:MAG: hypothetical protein U0136_20640 [Bdellovibrionota bacterium]
MQEPYKAPNGLIICRDWTADEWAAFSETLAALTHFLGLFPRRELHHLLPILAETPVLPFAYGTWCQYNGYWVPVRSGDGQLIMDNTAIGLVCQAPLDEPGFFALDINSFSLVSGYAQPQTDWLDSEYIVVDSRFFRPSFGFQAYRILVHEAAHIHSMRIGEPLSERPAFEAELIFSKYLVAQCPGQAITAMAAGRIRWLLERLH